MCILRSPRTQLIFHQSTWVVTGPLVIILGHSPNTKYFKGRHHVNFYTSLYLQYPVQQLPTVQQIFVKGINITYGCGWLWALGYKQEIDCCFLKKEHDSCRKLCTPRGWAKGTEILDNDVEGRYNSLVPHSAVPGMLL